MLKKLLFVIPSLGCGGAEKILIQLLAALNKDSYETELIVFQQRVLGCASFQVSLPVTDLKKKGAYDTLKLILKLTRAIKEKQPDLIISFITYANYLTLIAKIISGTTTPIVVAEHGVVSKIGTGLSGTIKKLIVRTVYPWATRVIAVSDGSRKELIQKFKLSEDKITVIPNGVDIKHINRLAQETVSHPWFNERIPIFITIGRLSKVKNHKLLICAFSLLAQKGDYRLAIIGEGDQESNLQELAKFLRVESKVAFLGYQPNPYSYLKKASVFVLSSSWESFSLVIVEAMCLRVPVISTDCPFGPREIIDNKINGILVKPHNAQSLAKAMYDLVSNDSLMKKYGENGFKKSQSFDLSIMVDKYISLVNSTMEHVPNSAHTSG